MFLLTLGTSLPLVTGHGSMMHPPTWMDAGGKTGMSAGLQGQAGCEQRGGDIFMQGSMCSAMWFTNYTHIPGEATLPNEMRSYKAHTEKKHCLTDQIINKDFSKNPWMAPGTAMNYPCGLAGGNPTGCGGGAYCPGGGWGYGPDARTYKGFKDIPVTDWEAGSVQDVAWGINANHGGGYSYRLCPRGANLEDNTVLTEECFQAGQLDFVGDTQWIQYGKDKYPRMEIEAKRTRTGTYPAGSQWTRNPIPACDGIDGMDTECIEDPFTHQPVVTSLDGLCEGPEDTQFTPPGPGLYGYGVDYAHNNVPSLNFNVVDQIQVPKDLKAGRYVLSWRWDCEQSSQVWSTCSEINIKDPSSKHAPVRSA